MKTFLRVVYCLFLAFPQYAFGAAGVRIITQDTTWTGAVTLTDDVIIQPGRTLTISPGTTIALQEGISITADSSARIIMAGTATQPIHLFPAQPGTYWYNIHARGQGAVLDARFVEAEGGQLKASDSATGFIQDCFLHDYNLGSNPIIFSEDASFVYVTRTHISNYYEINLVRSMATVEDCLFEFTTADAIDFDNSPAGTVIRRTTIRYGRGTNIDAIDWGKVDFKPPGSQGLVENCLVHDFSDKGVSVGEGCLGVTVKGSLFYRCGAGVAVKDSSLATIFNNTFYQNEYAIEAVEKNEGLGGGHGVAYNNIFWRNGASTYLNSDATLDITYSNADDLAPDTGRRILSVYPMFADTTLDDYRLMPGSPCVGQGINGEDLGAFFPLGGITPPSDELRLGTPNAVSVLPFDTTISVYWASGPAVSQIDLHFSSDSGTTWTELISGMDAAIGTWEWQVPHAYSSNCFFRIRDHDTTTARSAMNRMPFKIVPPPVPNLKPDFSVNSGFFQQPISLALTSTVPGSVIHYTLDGSEPDDRSPVFTQMLDLKGDTISYSSWYPTQNVTASAKAHSPYSYVCTAPSVPPQPQAPPSIWYRPSGDIDKQCVVRARVFHPSYGLGPVVSKSYFIHPDANGARYPLPVISLITPPEKLYDYYTGVMIPGASYKGRPFTGNYELSGRASEIPGHIDYFDSQKNKQLSQEIGIRVKGQWIRSLGQKCLGIYAREDYDLGEDDLDAEGIPDNRYPGTDTVVNQYKRLLLRQNGNDWGNYQNTMCRDAVAQSLLDHCRVKFQKYQPSMLYLNGEFYGLQNIREMNDEEDLSRQYFISEDSLVIMEDNLDEYDETPYQLLKGHDGEKQLYFDMRNRIFSADVSDPSQLDVIRQLIDVDNFTDYWIATIFLGKTTSAHNQCYWRVRTPDPESYRFAHDGRWRWLAFDFDNALFDYSRDDFSTAPYLVYDGLLRQLWKHPAYVGLFVNRFADLMNSSFLPQRMISRIDSVEQLIAPVMPYHIDRWSTPRSMAEWQDGMNVMRQFSQLRPQYVKDQIKTRFGLSAYYPLTVDISEVDAGYIRVNSLLIDKHLPGVDTNRVYPWTGDYFSGVPVSVTAYPMPGYVFDHWKETGETLPVININTSSDITRTAVFKSWKQEITYTSAYPNPAHVGEQVVLDHPCEYYLYSVDGKEFRHELNSRLLSTYDLPAGLYLLRIVDGPVERLTIIR